MSLLFLLAQMESNCVFSGLLIGDKTQFILNKLCPTLFSSTQTYSGEGALSFEARFIFWGHI